MLSYLGYLIFILTVAFAALGVVLTTKLRNRYKHDIFSTLLYFQVFIFTFGFYGIWGQALIKLYLSKYISPDLLTRFSDFALLLGMPFLIFAWLMQLRFSLQISGRKNTNWFVLWFLLVNFIVIILLGYSLAKISSLKTTLLIRYYFISFQFIYSTICSLLILFAVRGKTFIHNHEKRGIAAGIFITILLQCLPLILYSTEIYLALIFIFFFFGGNIFIPVYLSYGTLLTAFEPEPEKDLSLESFCRKYEVSPRETDIVREICNGLSNKEISEKLFISLQTVKDHTHRIYIKTNVRGRVQLMNLVKELR